MIDEYETYILTRIINLKEMVLSFENNKIVLKKIITDYMDSTRGVISDFKTQIVNEHNQDIDWMNKQINHFQEEIDRLQNTVKEKGSKRTK